MTETTSPLWPDTDARLRRAKQEAYNRWLVRRVEEGHSPSVFEYTLFSEAFESGWSAHERDSTEDQRERVTHIGTHTWAWVVRREASRTLVEFPDTGRTGWYANDLLRDWEES